MNVIDKIHMLKKILKEANNIVAWQEDIYTQLNILAGKTKAGNVTDTTNVDGKILVTFATPFVSTPVVIIQLEGDVDYYSVITARSVTGFTVKILKTAHKHSQGNTGVEAAHTHGIDFVSGAGTAHHHSNPNTSSTGSHRHSHSLTSGAGSAHHHTNPNTSAVSAGTPSGTISSVSAGTPSGTVGAEALHTHGISFTSGAGSAHHHSNPTTGTPTLILGDRVLMTEPGLSAACTVAGSPGGASILSYSIEDIPKGNHRHTQDSTGDESTHTHSVSGTSEAGSSHSHSFTGDALATHNHTFTGSALGTHSHTQGNTGNESAHTHSITGYSSYAGSHSHTIADTGNESAHTHSVSGTSGASGAHSHPNPNTSTVNAGNLLANTAVTFSYIAMIP